MTGGGPKSPKICPTSFMDGPFVVSDAVGVPQHCQRGGVLHHPAARDAIACKVQSDKRISGISSQMGTKSSDWAIGQAGGRLLLSGSIVLKWLKDAVCRVVNTLLGLWVIWGHCCPRVAAAPSLPNGPITQLSPYFTRKPSKAVWNKCHDWFRTTVR